MILRPLSLPRVSGNMGFCVRGAAVFCFVRLAGGLEASSSELESLCTGFAFARAFWSNFANSFLSSKKTRFRCKKNTWQHKRFLTILMGFEQFLATGGELLKYPSSKTPSWQGLLDFFKDPRSKTPSWKGPLDFPNGPRSNRGGPTYKGGGA